VEQITELRENAGIDRQQLIGRKRRALTGGQNFSKPTTPEPYPSTYSRANRNASLASWATSKNAFQRLNSRRMLVTKNLRRALDHVAKLHAAYVELTTA
jgi:hypothetical protein